MLANLLILPIGSFEQHGPHLPMTTDLIIAEHIAGRLAETLAAQKLPALAFSCSHEHRLRGGDLSLRPSTLELVIRDLVESAPDTARWVLVSWHGGNRVLVNIVRSLNIPQRRLCAVPLHADRVKAHTQSGMATPPEHDLHAGEMETSMMLHLAPDLVGDYRGVDFVAEDADIDNQGMEISPQGILGRPSLAAAEKGARALELITALSARRIIETFKS